MQAAGAAEEQRQREEAAREEAAAEADWRRAFREAHARLDGAEERRRSLLAEADRAGGNMQYADEQRLRDLAKGLAAEVREAEDELHELERRASLVGVPRAWRGP